MNYDDEARSLKYKQAKVDRRSRLEQDHIKPLSLYVDSLRAQYEADRWEFPDFDPADGGINARLLFLFEKPGPKTSEKGRGSGFISRNNNDATASTTFQFMQEAKSPRHETVTWNVIPGWNGTIDIASDELDHWLKRFDIEKFISLLPKLKAIVLVGKQAQKARDLFTPYGKVFESCHPSARNRNNPKIMEEYNLIPVRWAAAYEYVLEREASDAENLSR